MYRIVAWHCRVALSAGRNCFKLRRANREQGIAMSEAAAANPGGLHPVQRAQRITSIDTLRGVALLGILLMNIVGFGLPFVAYFNPTLDGVADGPNFWAYYINWLLFEGSMRAVFSMLFGASVILLTAHAEEQKGGIGVANVYFRRTLLLIAFGVIDAYVFLWWGDILYLYGLAGLILFVFRALSPRTLLVISLCLFGVLELKANLAAREIATLEPAAAEIRALQAQGAALSEEQRSILDAFDTATAFWTVDAASVAQETAARRAGYLVNVAVIAPIAALGQSSYAYETGLWDAMAMMFLGMALYRWRVFDASRSWRFYCTMLIAGYGIGITTNAYELNMQYASGFSLETLAHVPTYDLGRGGTAFGHIALVMLLCKSGGLRWVTGALAAVGQMALTNYLTHSVVCLFIFTGAGFGLFGQLERYQLYYVVGAIWLVQLIVSPLWLRSFRFGPVEWVWRSLTYGARQPMRLAHA
jgi:uncharacterized protein